MESKPAESRYALILKSIYVVAAVVVFLWFASVTIGILLLFFFAVVLTLILNAPTVWLESKKLPRTAAALLVFFTMLLFLFLLGWLVVPRILEQVSTLVTNMPQYLENLKQMLSGALTDYPALQDKLTADTDVADKLPSTLILITDLGRYSLSLISSVFMFIIFLSLVIYMLLNPAPLVESYLKLFSEDNRPKAARALAKASTMVIGWMWSNLVVGSMEAIAVWVFLYFMEVPGVWVWAGLALFAEMVPKIGPYLMAVPPILIALSIDPMTALWVGLFYLVLNELMGDLVMPRIRASTMNLHPVSSLFMMLAMASAFGIAGALIATPLTAFMKAYYEEFFAPNVSEDKLQQQVETVLHRQTDT